MRLDILRPMAQGLTKKEVANDGPNECGCVLHIISRTNKTLMDWVVNFKILRAYPYD